MIANFTVILGHTGFALRDDGGCIVQLAHALLFGMVILGVPVAFLRSLNNRTADLLALMGNFVCFQIGQSADGIAQEGQARESEKLLKLHDCCRDG